MDCVACMWQSHQVRHNFELTQLTQSQVEILNIFEINDIQQYVCISDKNPNMKVKFFPLGLKALTRWWCHQINTRERERNLITRQRNLENQLRCILNMFYSYLKLNQSNRKKQNNRIFSTSRKSTNNFRWLSDTFNQRWNEMRRRRQRAMIWDLFWHLHFD